MESKTIDKTEKNDSEACSTEYATTIKKYDKDKPYCDLSVENSGKGWLEDTQMNLNAPSFFVKKKQVRSSSERFEENNYSNENGSNLIPKSSQESKNVYSDD